MPFAPERKSPQVKRNVIWTPFKKQELALSCPAFELLYGGAPGGGKSDVLVVNPLMNLKHKGFKALILRRKYIDLERSLIMRSHELYRGRGTYNAQNKRWLFANDCSIEFGHCQKVSDVYNYQSAQYSFIGIEQLEQFTEQMYLFFFSRIRTTNPDIKPMIRSNCNPGGIGHSWIKKRFFIGEKEPNKIHKIKESLTRPDGKVEEFEYGRVFIPSLVYDNEHIMKNDRQYLMRLMQLPEPQRTAYLEGRFDLFEGQFFKEFDKKIHTCSPFEIPKDWKRSISFDWGFSDPTCILWTAEDPKSGQVFVYREVDITKTIDVDVSRKMKDMSEGEKIDVIYYPWDLDNKNPQTGVSMKERMMQVFSEPYWKQANKDRKNGWASVRHFLGFRPDKKPRMMIFNTCKHLVESFPEQVFDDNNSEDLDTLGNDHHVDALRYLLATFRQDLREDKRETERVYDVGGAVKKSDGKFYFKKEEPIRFNWMVD